MVKVTCEKTGIEFEAQTKRTRNHPAIMSVVNEANKNGWYREAMQVLDEHYGELQTVEEYITLLRAAEAKKNEQEKARIHEENVRKNAEKEARRSRFATNSFLRDHNYVWKKFQYDEEDVDLYGAPEADWTLYAPDGHVVSTRQAMQELFATTGNTYAKEWLVEHDVVIAPESEDEALAYKEAKEVQIRAEEKLSYEHELINHLTKLGISEQDASERAKVLSGVHHPEEEEIFLSAPVQLDGEDFMTPVFHADLMEVGMLLDETWYSLREMKLIKQFIEQCEAKYGA